MKKNHAPMVIGWITHVTVKPVLRLLTTVAAHPAIARNFGQNRGCLDLGYATITPDYGGAGNVESGCKSAVYLDFDRCEKLAAGQRAPAVIDPVAERPKGALHGQKRGVVNVDSINFLGP